MKKNINSTKDVETFLFCKKIKEFGPKNDDRLLDKDEITDIEEGLKILNLEEDEDISHHIEVSNQFKDQFNNEQERYTS